MNTPSDSFDTLSTAVLFRPGKQLRYGSQHERSSIDFCVNGEPLLQLLVRASDGHSDYMGCVVAGFPEENAESIARLLGQAAPDTESGRVRLYQCPECAHISCGLYSVRIERTARGYVWQSFAHEGSYEETWVIDGVGPYLFREEQYTELMAGLKVAYVPA